MDPRKWYPKQQSRGVWELPDRPTDWQRDCTWLVIGCLQRIADAAERVPSSNYEISALQRRVADLENLLSKFRRDQFDAGKAPDTPIRELELSIRARKALNRLGVETVRDLVRVTESELRGQRNVGQTTLNEIKRSLADLALQLREEK